jgi:hypothetical protein
MVGLRIACAASHYAHPSVALLGGPPTRGPPVGFLVDRAATGCAGGWERTWQGVFMQGVYPNGWLPAVCHRPVRLICPSSHRNSGMRVDSAMCPPRRDTVEAPAPQDSLESRPNRGLAVMGCAFDRRMQTPTSPPPAWGISRTFGGGSWVATRSRMHTYHNITGHMSPADHYRHMS